MDDDGSRATAYTGPHVIVTEEELPLLGELLQLYPRPWNSSLRERIDHARKRKQEE